MNKLSKQKLSALKIGDSFKTRGRIWRVRSLPNRWGFIACNQFERTGMPPIHKKDTLMRGGRTVTFIRHTIPIVGKETFLEDLQAGDFFKMPSDPVHEYVVAGTGHEFARVRRLTESVGGRMHNLSTVIFLRSSRKMN